MVEADLMIREFRLEKPVTFKESARHTAVRAMPDRTVIVFVRERPEDLPELLAEAKLGEKDPLLVTFLCQADATKEQTRCFKEFIRLCQPVLRAWAFRTMRQWVPLLYYEKIQKIRKVLDRAGEAGMKVTARTFPALLGLLAIAYETEEENFSRLGDHSPCGPLVPNLERIKGAIVSEPDIGHYLALVTGTPYTVTVETAPDGVSYYRVKCR
ncbi:MAG: hypothetical protein ABSC55_14300 [Syntrophorhabdales bacterium]